MKKQIFKTQRLTISLAAFAAISCLGGARADEVNDWNENAFAAMLRANLSPVVSVRAAAIVQATVFDAVNGVYNRYTPVHVPPAAPNGASARAAVVQAAYGALVHLFPNQKPTLDFQLAASLANLTDEDGTFGQAVERGLDWGQYVADQMWAWRSADGFTPPPPPFLGGTNIGQWRPTPPGFLPGAVPQLGHVTPWFVPSTSAFRPAGPPALGSAQYAADVNEVKVMGSASSAVRTADQTLFSIFWNGNTPGYWDRTALQLADRDGFSLLEKARLLALANVAMSDASICCWEAKYTYVFWRPITAIVLADLDGNPDTAADPSWTPLLITPPFPEYPSGHAFVSAAAATVLTAFFGDANDFSVTSELTPGVTRYYSSFSSAVAEISDARVFGGIHFRSACNDANDKGEQVGNYVLAHALQRRNGSAPLNAAVTSE
jgi:hypothetical protein